ncbi:NAD(P)-binding protein [Thozetella sp. PMI_491]|nr:NAD(P)-binding protein [Thozetella sp. PMI_491]
MAGTHVHATYPDLQGKVVLLMGMGQAKTANSDTWGNGAAIAWVLARNGCKVFGCDIDLGAAEHTASRVRQDGGVCDVMAADVTSASDIARVVDAVMKKHGRIDILVNNVGATAAGDPATMPEAVWDKQIALNLKSVYLACHAVLPIMEKQGSGAVINNASIAGIKFLGKPQVAYASAKAAVIHFTRVTGVMFAAKGVRVNALAPGLMFTPLVEQMKESSDPSVRETFNRITRHNVPMGFMGDALDVANAAAFLASQVARYVTGQTLVVDGALTSSTGTGFYEEKAKL